MKRVAMMLAVAVSGCASMNPLDRGPPEPDDTLRAVLNATPKECPAGRTLENARIGSDNESRGAEIEDIALTPLASDPSRALRLRRITLAPGGVIAWHTHDVNQGMALLVSGEATEFRNTCLDPIRYRTGDVASEDAQTAHGWRNQSDEPAVFIVAHVVPRQN
jgi:quercetin dioxygenase-like cupin family protein